MNHLYANHAVVSETDTEVVLDLYLRTEGKPQHQVRVILAPLTAAKLGVLLTPPAEAQPVAEQVALVAQTKAKRSRKPKAASG